MAAKVTAVFIRHPLYERYECDTLHSSVMSGVQPLRSAHVGKVSRHLHPRRSCHTAVLRTLYIHSDICAGQHYAPGSLHFMSVGEENAEAGCDMPHLLLPASYVVPSVFRTTLQFGGREGVVAKFNGSSSIYRINLHVEKKGR